MARLKDLAHRQTNKRLEEIESEIDLIYSRRAKKIKKMYDAYFGSFAEKDAKAKATMSEDDYKAWRLKTITGGVRWQMFCDRVAREMAKTKQEALDYMNGQLADVFADNYNYVGVAVERLIDERSDKV